MDTRTCSRCCSLHHHQARLRSYLAAPRPGSRQRRRLLLLCCCCCRGRRLLAVLGEDRVDGIECLPAFALALGARDDHTTGDEDEEHDLGHQQAVDGAGEDLGLVLQKRVGIGCGSEEQSQHASARLGREAVARCLAWQNCLCCICSASSRMGNLTSATPTMFWILNSLNPAASYPHFLIILAKIRHAFLQSSSLLAPVTTILPVLNTRAVVLGSLSRITAAVKRCVLFFEQVFATRPPQGSKPKQASPSGCTRCSGTSWPAPGAPA